MLADGLDVAARALGEHVAAEGRRSWSAASASLRVTTDGRVCVEHFPLVGFEYEGFRALLMYYSECFPRATACLSKLTPETFASVWYDLFHPLPPEVRVCERRGSVFMVAPTTYPVDYDVSQLVLDIASVFSPAPTCLLEYTAATSSVDLLLDLGRYNVRVQGTDAYDAGGVRCSVVSKRGVDLGDPLPDLRKRRKEGGSTIIDGVVARLRAAPDYYQRHNSQEK